MPDHIHMLISCDPQFGIHKIVKRIKGRSSRYLRQEFPQLKSKLPTLWTNSYFVATVGGAPYENANEHQLRYLLSNNTLRLNKQGLKQRKLFYLCEGNFSSPCLKVSDSQIPLALPDFGGNFISFSFT